MKLDYARAGVDVKKVKGIHSSIEKLISQTHTKNIVPVFGHYAGLVNFGNKILAMHTDGVGSKVLVAQFLKKYDTVGIDCVAMNVNDLICVGATPIALVDYIALRKEDEYLVNELMRGLVKGAQEANVAIIGGETAILPDIIKEGLDYSGLPTNGFDLAATCIGVVNKDKIITGKEIKINDVVIGLESSGLHSNGYTLARKVLSLNKWGDELLIPTRIYVKPVLEVLKKVNVHGLAHITGGAFSKLDRLGKIAKKGFLLDNVPEPSRIFNEIQTEADVDDKEMYSVFNMGVGFCVIAGKRDANKVIEICRKHNCKASIIGRITSEERVEILKDGVSLIL